MRAVVLLRDAQAGHATWRDMWQHLKPLLLSGHQIEVDIRPARRSTEQNAKLWAMLGEVSQQVVWHGQHLSPEDWKHVFTAAQKKQRVAPGIDGGFVVLGQSTSRMSRAEMSELIELIHAFGAEHGVRFRTDEEIPA